MLFFIVNEIGWQWVNIDDTREIKQMTVEKTQKKSNNNVNITHNYIPILAMWKIC